VGLTNPETCTAARTRTDRMNIYELFMIVFFLALQIMVE